MNTFDTMGKQELRQACRDNGISYSKLNNDGMRAALKAKVQQCEDDLNKGNEAFATREAHNGISAMVNQMNGTVKTPESSKTTTMRISSGVKIEKNREERNGVKRPSIGGLCRAVWDQLDAMYNKSGENPKAKDLREWAEQQGMNTNNASIELYQWRKFMGISSKG